MFLLAYIYLHVCLVPVEAREGLSFPDTGITDIWCWEPGLDWQEQQVLLIMSNLSGPYTSFFRKNLVP